MPIGNWNLEWLNVNSQRRYPLTEDSSCVDVTGTFKIPNDFLLELDLPINAGMNVDPSRFFVYQIGVYAGGYSVVIGYQPASGPAVSVATAFVNATGFRRSSCYVLGGVGSYDDTVGKLVIGRLDSISQQPAGQWTFALSGSRIEPDCVRPMIQGVTSLVCINGDQQTVPVTGDVQLVAGQNMQITPVLVSGQDPVIVFSAIDGAGTVEQCVCTGSAAPSAPITTINGVGPDANGNVNVVGSDCLQVQAIANGIQLVNSCSQPCCGCQELETITQDLERFGQQVAAVNSFISQLQSSVNTMDLVVLGARLGDRGCPTGCSG